MKINTFVAGFNSMASKVQVPMDFGVKYLGSPSHGNLKFRLQEGGEIPANSMIISYNSPVIESLTTDLMQTSIDVDDFSKDAVEFSWNLATQGNYGK